ncbi:MAG TPA: putative sulfate exporter family transporter [Rhodocyclaceae bacterium]
MNAIRSSLPGLALITSILMGSVLLSKTAGLDHLGLSPAALGILLGALLGNLWPGLHSNTFKAGIEFAQKHLLRWGIVLFGFHLSLQQVLSIGKSGVMTDVVMVLSTLALGLMLGKRFGLDKSTALLTAVGSAICGAAAIAATAPLVDAKTEKVTAAVGTVVLFGTLGMGIYPLINHWGPATLHQVFGTYIGSTVHEVAQVVAIGTGLGESTARSAIVVKMLRVLMLMPFLLALGLRQPGENPGQRFQHMPWFALGFIAAAAINSLEVLPSPWVQSLQGLGAQLLASAMIALGLGTTLSRIRAAGFGPLLLGGILFIHLVLTGALVNHYLA